MSRKVCIVGMGLIGGSIALAIKKEHQAEIIGVDIDNNQLKLAESLKIIDQGTSILEEGVRDANLIILATPVTKTEGIMEELQALPLSPGAIITDVGSTKQRINEKAKCLNGKEVTFIGGHPMAGSHKSGVQAAKSHLFENAFYVLTPGEQTNMNKIIQLQNWLKGTKAKFIEMTPQQHDQLAGAVSHFPHVIAAGLVHRISSLNDEDGLVTRLAAGGFRDITRIASSSPVMWRDILLHNKETLLSHLREWQKEMDQVYEMIDQERADDIYSYFDDAKIFRDELPSRQQGAIPAFYDLFVDVPDHPGVISDVTAILAREGISITNIRIIETREDIMGVLCLSFRSEREREQAQERLNEELYETYMLD